jgi:hypothetical protein
MTLHVITTATPRKELHVQTLGPTLDILSEKISIKLHVNIDNVLGQQEYEESIDYFKSLPHDTDLILSNSGSFKVAAKKLYTSFTLEENDLFFWLEDDWKFAKNQEKFVQAVIDLPNSKNDFIIAGIRNQLNGNPFVGKKFFFDDIQNRYNDIFTIDDPEIHIWRCATARYGDRFALGNYLNLTGTFTDMGREWREEKNISKENKRSDKLKTWHFE